MSLFSRLLAIIVSLKYYFMLDYFTTTVDCPYFEYSISRTLLYLKQFIRSHGHIALDQSKKLSVSRISIFRIFAYVKQTFRSLEQVSLVISNFPQCFQNFPCNFSFQISIFSTTASTIAANELARMSKDPQINFLFCCCCFFVWSNVSTQFFYH